MATSGIPNYRYIVPSNTTFNLGDSRCYVTNTNLVKPITSSKVLTLDSPYGNTPCLAEAYFFYSNLWRKAVAEGLANNRSNDVYGILVSCPGDGKVYLSVGGAGLCGNRNTSCVPATGTIVTSAEVVILLVPLD